MSNILLVEPDKYLASLYAQALKESGYEVFQARTIEHAVVLLDTNHVDVLILELQIAQHNGIELLYEMRSYEDWNAIRIIVQSTIPQHTFMPSITVKHLRVDEYLYKPKTSLFALCATVQKVLSRQHA